MARYVATVYPGDGGNRTGRVARRDAGRDAGRDARPGSNFSIFYRSTRLAARKSGRVKEKDLVAFVGEDYLDALTSYILLSDRALAHVASSITALLRLAHPIFI